MAGKSHCHVYQDENSHQEEITGTDTVLSPTSTRQPTTSVTRDWISYFRSIHGCCNPLEKPTPTKSTSDPPG